MARRGCPLTNPLLVVAYSQPLLTLKIRDTEDTGLFTERHGIVLILPCPSVLISVSSVFRPFILPICAVPGRRCGHQSPSSSTGRSGYRLCVRRSAHSRDRNRDQDVPG